MTRGKRDTLSRWWFAGLVLAFAGVAAAWALAPRAAPPAAETPPPRVVHNPDPARPDFAVRDPFMTGPEWRAQRRERAEPAPVASATAAAPVFIAPPPAPGSELGFAGTMLSGSQRYAILSAGMFRVGAQVGRYTILEIDEDRIVLRYDDKSVVLKVTSSGSISTVTTSGSW